MQAVSKEALEQAQAIFGANRPDIEAVKSESLDVEAYLGHYGIEVVKLKQNGTSTLYCLRECVFDRAHTTNGSAIGITSEGKLFYQCFHNSCNGRTWKEARQKISGNDSLAPFLPSNEDKPSLAERIGQLTKDTPFKNIKEILQDIARLDTDSEKAIHTETLCEKNGYSEARRPPRSQGTNQTRLTDCGREHSYCPPFL